ncbi:hypothetical protein ACLKA7_000082, partial [Drosophila subpalustris]
LVESSTPTNEDDSPEATYTQLTSSYAYPSNKILLINEVEKRPILWDLTDRKHFDAVCIKNAWKSVAETLNRSEDECKVAWKSLRDSYRYHCKVAGKKSGSAGGVGPQQPRANDAVEWHLAPYMSFLPEMSSQRR